MKVELAKKKVTFGELLDNLWQELLNKGEIPDIALDDLVSLNSRVSIESPDYRMEFNVTCAFEGYCLELGVSNKGRADYFPIGKVQSHYGTKHAYSLISALGAEIKYLFDEEMCTDRNRFIWEGYLLCWVTDEGDLIKFWYENETLADVIEEIRKEARNKLSERADYVEIYDLSEKRDIIARYNLLTDEVEYFDDTETVVN